MEHNKKSNGFILAMNNIGGKPHIYTIGNLLHLIRWAVTVIGVVFALFCTGFLWGRFSRCLFKIRK